MPKQLNINLAFTADTGQAKRQLQDLQQQLSQLMTKAATNTKGLGLTQEINEAIKDVGDLKVKLQEATTSSGTLDLGKFNQSLMNGNKSIKDYATSLNLLGPEGTRAFSQIAKSVTTAELPIKRANSLLAEFSTTLQNTVRWQLSSSILHGFMSALQSAYGYAKDLDESLTNIRIVTGHSTEYMANFAEQANKAAQSLKTSTTAYTDAALIYYQQGLNDEDVAARTEATIKMAQATGDSADEVSSYMTAIWNNFDDGSESLEHYADVITALGASTASSSAEIASGLQQFAAIAETTGLSYDYATSALATLVANTRQSADTVGNSLKTIFSRLQGLSLGETLDDGVNLNKYSSALKKVGVDVIDANGSLRDMDNILDDLSVKWNQIEKAEKMALAQTVAGTRQYTYLMSLMDNWDDMQKNLTTADNAEGALTEQAEIYQESWKAARDEVRAAWQAIYQDLLDPKFFKSFLSVISSILKLVDGLIDGVGGMNGVLLITSNLLVNMFSNKIADDINRIFYNMQIGSEQGRQALEDMRSEFASTLQELASTTTNGSAGAAVADIYKGQASAQQALIDRVKELQQENITLTDEEQKQVNLMLDQLELIGRKAEETARLTETQKGELEVLKFQMEGITTGLNMEQSASVLSHIQGAFQALEKKDKKLIGNDEINSIEDYLAKLEQVNTTYGATAELVKNFGGRGAFAGTESEIENVQNQFQKLYEVISSSDKYTEVFKEKVAEIANGNFDKSAAGLEKVKKLYDEVVESGIAAGHAGDEMSKGLIAAFTEIGVPQQRIESLVKEIVEAQEAGGRMSVQLQRELANYGIVVDSVTGKIKILGNTSVDVGQMTASVFSGLSGYAMGLNQLNNAIANLQDGKITLQDLVSITMAASTAMRTYNALSEMASKIVGFNITQEKLRAKAKEKAAAAEGVEAAAEVVNSEATAGNTAAKGKNIVATKGEEEASKGATLAKEAETAATLGLKAAILGVAAVIAAVVLAYQAYNRSLEKRAEALKETADKQVEEANAIKEEIESLKDLEKAYSDALKTYQETGDGKDSLEEASLELISAYGLENDAILIQIGNYEKLTESIRHARTEKAKEARDKANDATDAAGEAFVNEMRGDAFDAKGYNDNNYTAGFDWEFNTNDNRATDIIANLLSQNSDEYNKLSIETPDYGTADRYLSLTTGQLANDIAEGYEQAQALYDEAIEKIKARYGDDAQEVIDSSTWLTNIKTFLDDASESYKTYTESAKRAEEAGVEFGIAAAQEKTGLDGNTIDSLEKYQELVEAIKKENSELEDEDINSYLAINDSTLASWAAIKKAEESLNSPEEREKFDKYYDSLTEGERVIALQALVDSAETVESVQEAVEAGQAEADKYTIQVQASAAKTDLEAIEKGKGKMSADDWTEFANNSQLDWGNSLISMTEFMAKSYEDQVQYLLNLENQYKQMSVAAAEEGLKQAEDNYNTLQENYNKKMTEASTKYGEAMSAYLGVINTEGIFSARITEGVTELQGLTSGTEEYNKALAELSENAHLTTAQEEIIDSFVRAKEAVNNVDEELQQAKDNVQSSAFELAAKQAELLSDRLNNLDSDLDADNVMDFAESLLELGEAGEEGYETIKDLESALDASERSFRINNAVEDLADNWEDYCDVLKDVQKAENKTDKAMALSSDNATKLKETLADLLDVNEDLISNDLFDKIDPDVLKEAANGSEEAVQQIRDAYIDLQGEMLNAEESASSFKDYMNQLSDGDIIDLSLDDTQFINALIAAEIAAGSTADEIETKLSGMGIDCDITPLYGSLEDAKNASLEAGDAIIENTSFNAKAETDTAEQQGVAQEVSTSVDITEATHKWTATVPEADGTTAGPKEISGTFVAPEKKVTTEPLETEITQQLPVVAMKVENAHKSAGGKISSSHRGRARAARGTRRSGGGRRRSSGSRAKDRSNKDLKTHKDIEDNLKNLKDEKDRYHEINNTLDDLNEKLTKYDTIANRAFGKSKVKAIKDQIKVYKELQKATDQKLAENAQYLKEDKKEAKKYGWTFDKDGNVNNYDENQKALIDRYNAAQEKYLADYNAATNWFNGLSGDQQAEDSNKKEYDRRVKLAEEAKEDAEKYYDKASESLKKYEEDMELREEELQKKREYLNAEIDKALEAVDVTVQVHLTLDEADLKLIDELIENLGDGADTAVDNIALLGDKVKYLADEAEAAKDGIKGILEVYTDKDKFGDKALSNDLVQRIMSGGALSEEDKKALQNVGITEESISQIQSYQDQLYSTNKSLRELQEQAIEKAGEAFSEYTDELDRNSESITHLQKVTSTYKNIIDIVGKKVLDSTGELSKQLSRTNYELQRNNTHALKSELDFIDSSIKNAKNAIEKLERENLDGANDSTLKKMRQQLKDMEDQRNSTYESWLDSWEAEMQAAADIYSETLANIVDNFKDSIAGTLGSLDDLQKAYERKKKIDDIYVNDYEKIYELSKLNRDIEKSIDDTDNLKSKQGLRDLLEEINELEAEGVELSTYDIENARRRYELELAKEQLREAQSAKSTVRMTRDLDGNYGYVYTADESKVAEAEQNYEDKLYAIQKANAEYINELQSNLISLGEECAAAIEELDATQFDSHAEYLAAVEQIQSDYNQIMDGYAQQFNQVINNNRNLYETDWQEYSDATGYKISADEDYIDKFEETQYSLLTGFDTIEDAQDTWKNAVQEATEEAGQAWREWYDTTQEALSDGQTSVEEYADTVNTKTEEVKEKSGEVEKSAQNMAEEYSTAYNDIINSLEGFIEQYNTKISNIISSNNQLTESINKVTRAAAGLMEVTDEEGNTIDLTNPQNDDGSGGGEKGKGSADGDDGMGGKKYNASWNKGYSAYKKIDAGKWGNGVAHRIQQGAKEGFTEDEVRLGQAIINLIYPKSQRGKGYKLETAKKMLGYDTGGYTGSWSSSEGRLALLHQKELVLNSKDTENFLQAVDIIRQISSTIDLNALSASNGMSSLLQSAGYGKKDEQVLEQTVHITADFSGVRDRSEIEAAFDNLINRAAQFANRKN